MRSDSLAVPMPGRSHPDAKKPATDGEAEVPDYNDDPDVQALGNAVFRMLDTDGNGQISASEFTRWQQVLLRKPDDPSEDVSESIKAAAEAAAEEMFGAMDDNGDERVDAQEWDSFCSALYEAVGRDRFVSLTTGWIERLTIVRPGLQLSPKAAAEDWFTLLNSIESSHSTPHGSRVHSKVETNKNASELYAQTVAAGQTQDLGVMAELAATAAADAAASVKEARHLIAHDLEHAEDLNLPMDPEFLQILNGILSTKLPKVEYIPEPAEANEKRAGSGEAATEGLETDRAKSGSKQSKGSFVGQSDDGSLPPTKRLSSKLRGARSLSPRRSRRAQAMDSDDELLPSIQKSPSAASIYSPDSVGESEDDGFSFSSQVSRTNGVAKAASRIRRAAKSGAITSEKSQGGLSQPNSPMPLKTEVRQRQAMDQPMTSIDELWELMTSRHQIATRIEVAIFVDTLLQCRKAGLDAVHFQGVPQDVDTSKEPLKLSGKALEHLCVLMIQQQDITEEEVRADLASMVDLQGSHGNGEAYIGRVQFKRIMSMLSKLFCLEEVHLISSMSWAVTGWFEINDSLTEALVNYALLKSTRRRIPQEGGLLQTKLTYEHFERLCYCSQLIDVENVNGLPMYRAGAIFMDVVRKMPELLKDRASKTGGLNRGKRIATVDFNKAEFDATRAQGVQGVIGRTEISILLDQVYAAMPRSAGFTGPLHMLLVMLQRLEPRRGPVTGVPGANSTQGATQQSAPNQNAQQNAPSQNAQQSAPSQNGSSA